MRADGQDLGGVRTTLQDGERPEKQRTWWESLHTAAGGKPEPRMMNGCLQRKPSNRPSGGPGPVQPPCGTSRVRITHRRVLWKGERSGKFSTSPHTKWKVLPGTAEEIRGLEGPRGHSPAQGEKVPKDSGHLPETLEAGFAAVPRMPGPALLAEVPCPGPPRAFPPCSHSAQVQLLPSQESVSARL